MSFYSYYSEGISQYFSYKYIPASTNTFFQGLITIEIISTNMHIAWPFTPFTAKATAILQK
jgi:hypothetical protein